MKKWLVGLILLVVTFCFGLAAAAEPQIPPAPTSSIYVQDYAGVLSSAAKNRINEIGAKLAEKTKAQVVVVTLKTTNGQPMDELGLGILRQWGIGDKKLNNGVLLLVATEDHRSRIEVGYGLEGALPDGKTGRIQDDYMIPYFKNNQYEQGIMNGYQALVSEVAHEYKVEVPQVGKAERAAPAPAQESSFPWWMKALAVAVVVILLLSDWIFFGGFLTGMILSLICRRGGGGGFGGGGYGGGGYGGGSGGGGGSNRGW